MLVFQISLPGAETFVKDALATFINIKKKFIKKKNPKEYGEEKHILFIAHLSGPIPVLSILPIWELSQIRFLKILLHVFSIYLLSSSHFQYVGGNPKSSLLTLSHKPQQMYSWKERRCGLDLL